MADILSQDEVDLLLNAVSQGEVPVEEEHIDRVKEDTREIMTYDFRRPERVSTEQLKGLQSLFEAFARELSIALPPFLRTVVRVDLLSIDQLTYDEFILSVSRPTCLSIINMTPLEGNALIELSPSVVFPIVDRILGGKGGMIDEVRELTEIENRIIQRVVLTILDSLRRSWEQLIEFRMSVVSQESDPLIVQIVAGSDMVILVGYEIHVGEAMGSMNMCIPLMFLNPVLDQISQQTRFIRKMNPQMAEIIRNRLIRTIRKVKVPVEAVLGQVTLTMNDVLHLEKGDIIQLDSNVFTPLSVNVERIERFKAFAGKFHEQSAVQITSIVRDE